jgi:penicillin-binding protein 1C
MVFSPRQPGSTLKPFLYRLALELRKISATGSIEDIPRAYTTAEGAIYEPKNYSLNFQ